MRSSTALKNEIRKWLEKRRDGEAKIVSIAEWKRRGEEWGSNSAFIMTIEGSPLYTLLNYGDDEWQAANELRAICQRHGFWYQHDYHWSLSFHEI